MPGIETPRLRLRPLEEADFDALWRVFGDASALPHFPRAFTAGEVRALLARHRALHAERGLGLRAVVLKETGEVVGDCGASPVLLDGAEEVEVGYHLAREHRGRGYATEAARAVAEDALARGVPRLVALVRPENLPSRRVAERAGFRVERETTWAGLRHLVYVRSHP